jgi:hypothetical protein
MAVLRSGRRERKEKKETGREETREGEITQRGGDTIEPRCPGRISDPKG